VCSCKCEIWGRSYPSPSEPPGKSNIWRCSHVNWCYDCMYTPGVEVTIDEWRVTSDDILGSCTDVSYFIFNAFACVCSIFPIFVIVISWYQIHVHSNPLIHRFNLRRIHLNRIHYPLKNPDRSSTPINTCILCQTLYINYQIIIWYTFKMQVHYGHNSEKIIRLR